MSLVIRAGRADDAQVCGEICHAAFTAISGAHNFPPDFPSAEAAVGLLQMALQHPQIHSVVAEVDGRPVGSNFLWEQSPIAGVGPITVDPGVQNSRIGRQLMEAVLARAAEQGRPGVRLVQAAFHGRSLSLYTRLGFDPREPLSNMQGPPIGAKIPGREVRAARAADLDACNALCLRVHGHHRDGELREAVAGGSATVVEAAGEITGYATEIGFFGHAVGRANEDLRALIAAAPAFAGPGMLVPTRNAELLRWCLEQGLRIVQPMTLMSKGLYNAPQGAFLPSILF